MAFKNKRIILTDYSSMTHQIGTLFLMVIARIEIEATMDCLLLT